MADTFDLGDLVELKGVFTDPDTGTALDPTTVTFKIREPDGTVTTYEHGTDAELVKDAVGTYRVNWPAAQHGTHWYRFESTGTGKAAEEKSFTVKATNIA